MTIPIQLKRSTVAAKVPLTTDLSAGELAFNVNDGILYGKKTVASVDTIVKLGGALVPSDVGLGNVNNTSDANKPVSTAQNTAINNAITTANSYTDTQVATNTAKIASINTHVFRFSDGVAVSGDYTASLQGILNSAIALNGAIVDITGDYSVSNLTVIGASGIKFTGRGSLIANSASAQTELLLMSNCTTIDADCTWFINTGYKTNYACAIRCDTKSSGQSFSGVQIDGTITPIAAQVGIIFGNPSRPDDLVSEIDWRTGKTYGCLIAVQAYGAQTVVSFTASNIATLFGSGNSGWIALPQYTLDLYGSTVNITGGELLKTESGAGALVRLNAINSATGIQYGMVNVTGAIVETAARLGVTTNLIGASSNGGFQFTGCHGVFSGGSPSGAAADVFEAEGLFNGAMFVRDCNFFASPARSTLPLVTTNGSPEVDILSSFKLGFTATLKNMIGGTGGVRRFKDQVLLDARNLNGQVFSGSGSSVAKFQTVASVGLSASYSASTGIFTVPTGGLATLKVSCQVINGNSGTGEWYIQSGGTSIGVRKLGIYSSNDCILYNLAAGTQIQVVILNGGFTGANNAVTDYFIITGSN
jgi:hypothetical protein